MNNKLISFLIQFVLYVWIVWMALSMLIVAISGDIIVIVAWAIVGIAVAYPLFWGARYFWQKEPAT